MSAAPEALVFDFDGLILDTETPQYHTVAAAFSAHGVSLDLADWQAIIGTAEHPHWSEMLAEALGERARSVDFELVRRERQEEYHRRLATETVLPGVEDLIQAALGTGLALAVASSSPRYWVDDHLTRLGLRGHFSSLHTREDVERTKPAPDLFHRAVEALDADPARTVVLEDSPHGVTAAKAAGLAVVACPNEVTRGQSFAHADLVVETLAAVDLAALGDLV